MGEKKDGHNVIYLCPQNFLSQLMNNLNKIKAKLRYYYFKIRENMKGLECGQENYVSIKILDVVQ